MSIDENKSVFRSVVKEVMNYVRFQTMDLLRFVGDKIAEHWAMPDPYGLRQQLGVIPVAGK